jgi:hypothetical protein
MRKLIYLIIALLIISSILPLRAQDIIKNSKVTGVCYAGNKISRFYIPPSKNFFRKGGSKSGGSVTIFYTGFSNQARTAMEFAKLQIEKMLPPDTKLTILASWEKITTSGVLAQSSVTQVIRGREINALNPLSYYPIALAEKIAGKSLNSDLDGDITLAVNSSQNWYLGTDGQTPTSKYDLVTVAIHEICHGLGFYEGFSSDGTFGFNRFGSLSTVYDTFVENIGGNRLTDSLKFPNNSAALLSQLTGGLLFFNGPLLKKYTAGSRAKLYAPKTWDPGSSVSHLDETATLRENSLMTPFINLGEAIHDPGQYTFSILGDLGWINTRIIHQPTGDTEDHLIQISLSAIIKSDTLYDHDRVGVVYSFNNFLTNDTVYLNSPGTNDSYSTIINIPSYNSDLQYYFFARDCFLRIYRSPSVVIDYPSLKIDNNRYKVFIGTDTVKPVITHTPVTHYLQSIDSIKYFATATDNLGIDSVYVEYKVRNGASNFIRLKKGIADDYSLVLSARTLLLKGRDSIQYRIFAVDRAKIPNIRVVPGTGFFVTRIEEIYSTVSTSYSTDFSSSAPDFFNIGFEVKKPAGFTKYGLNTKHPYESPEDNLKTIDFTSVLRKPLKFDGSGLLFSFNEVVLVEPGEAGSVFGSSDFYDYVIVEGSKNFGRTWFNLIDGYDSRLFPSWETAYNSSIVGYNSTFIGSESMLQKHVFLCRPSDNISAGDTLLVRFRLFSDPYSNGWGWVIEDLKIGPLIDAVGEINHSPVLIYPNPGKGIIKIRSDDYNNRSYKPLHYNVFNAAGIRLINAATDGYGDDLVNISDYPPGLYIIVLYLEEGIRTIKYSLIK